MRVDMRASPQLLVESQENNNKQSVSIRGTLQVCKIPEQDTEKYSNWVYSPAIIFDEGKGRPTCSFARGWTRKDCTIRKRGSGPYLPQCTPCSS